LALENYYNNDQQFNRQLKLKIRITTFKMSCDLIESVTGLAGHDNSQNLNSKNHYSSYISTGMAKTA